MRPGQIMKLAPRPQRLIIIFYYINLERNCGNVTAVLALSQLPGTAPYSIFVICAVVLRNYETYNGVPIHKFRRRSSTYSSASNHGYDPRLLIKNAFVDRKSKQIRITE